MREVKREKIAEAIHRLAAEFVRNEGTSASLLTITRVEINPSGKDAVIFFTTIPEDQQETAQKFLYRKIVEFKNYAKDHSRIGILPHLRFKIDFGERNRQRLDDLTKEL